MGNNDAAKAFYEKNEFTQEGGVFEGYYKKIDPPDAFMLKMDIEVTKTDDETKENIKPENNNKKDSTSTAAEKTESTSQSPSSKNNNTSSSGKSKNKKKGNKGKKKK